MPPIPGRPPSHDAGRSHGSSELPPRSGYFFFFSSSDEHAARNASDDIKIKTRNFFMQQQRKWLLK